MLRGLARNFRFAKVLLGKHYCECTQVALATASKRNEGRGIKAAGEENAERNVGNQVVTDGFFQQRTQLSCRVFKIIRPRRIRLERGCRKIPIALWLEGFDGNAGPQCNKVARRKRKYTVNDGGRLGKRTEQKK